MKDSSYTLFVASDRKGKILRWNVSSFGMKVFVFSLLFFAFLFSAVLVDYVGFLFESKRSGELKVENEHLKRQIEEIELKFSEYEGKVSEVTLLSEKIKKIVDLDKKNYIRHLGSSPVPAEKFQEESQRSLASMLHDVDPTEDISRLEVMESKDVRLVVRIDEGLKRARLQEQNAMKLWSDLSKNKHFVGSIPSIKPALGWISSRFGHRVDPILGKMSMHSGIDFVAAEGAPIYSPGDGVVSYVGYDVGYGKVLVIDHGYGVKTRYAHNQEILVKIGEPVKKWQRVASIGSTGRSTGPHLHYEVRVHGVPVDPLAYILN